MARKHIFCNIDSTYSIVFFSLLFNRAIIRFCVLDEFFANSEVLLLLLFVSFLLPGYASGCTVEVARYCLSNIKHIWYYVKQRHTKNVCAQYLVNDVLKCCTLKKKKTLSVYLRYAQNPSLLLYTIIMKTKRSKNINTLVGFVSSSVVYLHCCTTQLLLLCRCFKNSSFVKFSKVHLL